MNNWMEKFERNKDEQRERELNTKLEKLLDLLDKTYKNEGKIKILKEIIDVYKELKVDACDYDENDYICKKKELEVLRYRIKEQEHIESIESQSWNEFEEEEKDEERE